MFSVLVNDKRKETPCPTLSIRIDDSNPDHHLWNNNGTWFVHYTVYPSPITKERRRHSLHTKDLEAARRKRDELLNRLAS